MFGLQDFFNFLQAFFIVFPVVTILHLLGHLTFAYFLGCKQMKVVLGVGKKLFSVRNIEVRLYYFWHGSCSIGPLKYTNKYCQCLILFGGSLFNLLGILIANILIFQKVVEPSMLTYQFIYFSIYYVFFALLPMDFPDGTASDGKMIYSIWKGKRCKQTSQDCQNFTN